MSNITDAIELCRMIEQVCPQFGCHVALTGGTLYKDGERKDIDILFYRIRQAGEIDINGLTEALEKLGVVFVSGFGFCLKFSWLNHSIDAFFPEDEGEYTNPEEKK